MKSGMIIRLKPNAIDGREQTRFGQHVVIEEVRKSGLLKVVPFLKAHLSGDIFRLIGKDTVIHEPNFYAAVLDLAHLLGLKVTFYGDHFHLNGHQSEDWVFVRGMDDGHRGLSCLFQSNRLQTFALSESQHIRNVFMFIAENLPVEKLTPVSIPAEHRTSNVMGLANAIFHNHSYDRLPVLADALEESTYNDQRVLDHCRSQPKRSNDYHGHWITWELLHKS